jgi:hypothetical protein
MKLIVKKTKNLHRREVKSYRDPQTETPTMLAMYDMKTFLAWRDMLQDLGHNITTFVDQELKQGALKESGWTAASLCELFDSDILPIPTVDLRSHAFQIAKDVGRVEPWTLRT